ncbi:MAG: apolipoprotein N-acyltransferase [Rhodothermaceae bacterium]|nr:apolipoprotein N-acyltransferase [Rhodothermaceae bacterium]
MPPFGLYPLAWIALIPLLARWSSVRHPWTLVRETYATLLLMAAIAGFWVLLHRAMPAALLSGLGLLLAPLPHVGAFVLSAQLRKRFGLLAGLGALLTGVLAAEYLVAHSPFGLPWLLLGHTQTDALSFNQIADLGGVGALTLFVLVANILGLLFVRTRLKPGVLPGGRMLIALLFSATLSGAAVYGEERVLNLNEPTADLVVGLVQPALSINQWSDATDGQRVERLADLSDRLLRLGEPLIRPASTQPPAATPENRLDLLIWPETALPYLPETDRQARLYQRLARWSAQRNLALLTGGMTRPGAHGAFRNSALLFGPTASPQAYDQVHLTPFTETLPGVDLNPQLEAMVLPEPDAHLGTGDSLVVLDAGHYQVATPIGSESLRGDQVRRFVSDGANLIVTLSHGGWWGQSPGASQHLRLTRLRAIETRRAVVLATVSGITGTIDATGRIEPVAGWMEEEITRRTLPLHETETLYVQHGDWLGYYALFGAGWFLLIWGVAAVFFRRPKTAPRKRRRT